MVLASGSPRRRELLGQLVPDFEILVSNVPEEELPGEHPRSTAERLAHLKAEAVSRLRPEALIVAADTVVAYSIGQGWQQLAKPIDADDAEHMLRTLSGRAHSVFTGVTLVWPGGEWNVSDETRVTFRDLAEEEIKRYVATGEPMDKAGAYAIQGGAAAFVVDVKGSVSNVIGLPIETLSGFLESRKERGAAPA